MLSLSLFNGNKKCVANTTSNFEQICEMSQTNTVQDSRFSFQDFFSKSKQTWKQHRVWSPLLKQYSKNVHFYVVTCKRLLARNFKSSPSEVFL